MTDTKIDYNSRAAIGQAYNLAVHDAIASKKTEDREYIYSRFEYYYKIGQILQNLDLKEIKEWLEKVQK